MKRPARGYAQTCLTTIGVAAGGNRWPDIRGLVARAPVARTAVPVAMLLALRLLSDCVAAEPADGRWPRFRGEDGSGVYRGGESPMRWDGTTGEGVLWKTPVPLPGYSSPVVWGDRVLLTGADQDSREVYCLDSRTGRMLWKTPVGDGPGPPRVWKHPSYAAPTAVCDGRGVFVMFAGGDVARLDMDGRTVWHRRLPAPENTYGHCSSPVLHAGRLILQIDQGEPDERRSALVALDAASGETVWSVVRPVATSWSTPIIVRSGEQDQIVTSAIPRVISYDPRTGREIWRADCMEGGWWAAPSPVFARGLVVAGTDGAPLTALRPDGRGDVSRTHIAWSAAGTLPTVCSPVSDGELLFHLTSAGWLTCRDMRDGTKVWDADLAATDRSFEASPSIAAGRLYLLDSNGVMYVVAVERRFREIARNPLGEPCEGATPAFAQGRIYIRSAKHLWCVGPR